jgi:hypothetical protein
VTPRTCCQATLTLVNVGIAMTISVIAAGVVANASAATFAGRLQVWAAVSLALSAVAVWAGVWTYRAVGREWDRTEPKLPPSGGTPTDGHPRPQPERLTP